MVRFPRVLWVFDALAALAVFDDRPFLLSVDRARFYADLADRLSDTAPQHLSIATQTGGSTGPVPHLRELAYAPPRLGKSYAREQIDLLGQWLPIAAGDDRLSEAMRARVRIGQAVRALADEAMARGLARVGRHRTRRQARMLAVYASIMGHPGIDFADAVKWNLDAGEGAFLTLAASGRFSATTVRRMIANHAKATELGWPFPAIDPQDLSQLARDAGPIRLPAFVEALRYVAAQRLAGENAGEPSYLATPEIDERR